VWDEVDRVRSKFIQPVREALETNKLQCKGEMERVKGAGPRGKTIRWTEDQYLHACDVTVM